MIWHPKPGQVAIVNYKNKSMPFQGCECEVVTTGKGPGPRNVLVIIGNDSEINWHLEVVPRGNLNSMDIFPIN